jgi:hypothetical protein
VNIGCILYVYQCTGNRQQKQQECNAKQLTSDKNVYQELRIQVILVEQKPGAVIREKEITVAWRSTVHRSPGDGWFSADYSKYRHLCRGGDFSTPKSFV